MYNSKQWKIWKDHVKDGTLPLNSSISRCKVLVMYYVFLRRFSVMFGSSSKNLGNYKMTTSHLWSHEYCTLYIVHFGRCIRSLNKSFSHSIVVSWKDQHLQCKRSINCDIRWCNLNSGGSLKRWVQQAEVFWFAAVSESTPSGWIRSRQKLSVVPRVSSLKRCGSAEKKNCLTNYCYREWFVINKYKVI